MKDFPGIRPDDPKNVVFLMGHALHSCQRFEHCIQILVSTLSKLGVEGIEPGKADDILSGKSPKPLGQLIGILAKMTTINEVAQDWISRGLTARNNIVHRFFRENYESMFTVDSRAEVVSRIKILNGQVAEVHDFFVQVFLEICKVYEIASDADIEKINETGGLN